MSFGGEQSHFSHPEIKREGMDATMRIAMVGHKRVPSREGGIEVVFAAWRAGAKPCPDVFSGLAL